MSDIKTPYCLKVFNGDNIVEDWYPVYHHTFRDGVLFIHLVDSDYFHDWGICYRPNSGDKIINHNKQGESE